MSEGTTACPKIPDDHTHLTSLVAGKVSLSNLYRELHRTVERRLRTRNMFVAIVENGRFLSFPYYVDEKEPENELALYPMVGLTAAVISSRRRRWLAEERLFLDEVPYVGVVPADWLGVPVFNRKGEVLGALVVQSYDDSLKFSQADAKFLEFAATLLSLAIQLHEADREIAVRRIAALVEETTDLELLYPGIHGIVGALIPTAAKSFTIARIDRSASVFRQVYCVDERESFGRIHWPLDKGLSAYVAQGEGRAFIFEDGVTTIPDGFLPLGERPTFWLGVPIRMGPLVMGVAIVQTYDPADRITRDDERTLEEICPYIANAIARTEFFHHPWRGID